jgi:hypothetical protein
MISTNGREQVEDQGSLAALAPVHNDGRPLEGLVPLVQ